MLSNLFAMASTGLLSACNEQGEPIFLRHTVVISGNGAELIQCVSFEFM